MHIYIYLYIHLFASIRISIYIFYYCFTFILCALKQRLPVAKYLCVRVVYCFGFVGIACIRNATFSAFDSVLLGT